MRMQKEVLRGYLRNYPLMHAIDQKKEIDETKNRLMDAIQVLREVGASETTIDDATSKHDEYKKISQAYGNLIGDTWGITWQMESIIRKYTDYLLDDIDRLPDCVSAD